GGVFPATGLARTGVLLRPVPETAGLSNAAQSEPDVRELVPGASIGRELAGGQVHTYRIALTSGQYLHIIAETDDIEARLILFGPGGQKVTESYSPNGSRGPENILFIPEEAGSFRLEVRTTKTNAAPGRYELKIAEIRTATTEDRS